MLRDVEDLQSSHANTRRMNTLVYMRKETARVAKMTHNAIVIAT